MTQEGRCGEGGESACSPGDQILNVLDKGCVYNPWGMSGGGSTRWEQAAGQAQRQKDYRAKLKRMVLEDGGVVPGWRCVVSCF